MKKVTVGIVLALCVALWCSGCKEEDGPSLEEDLQSLVVAKVDRCPNGHNTMKAVAIQYGLIVQTAETREKVENYEVAYGGCCLGKYGDHKFVCTTCGCFTYEMIDPSGDGMAMWYDRTTKIMGRGEAIIVTENR